jgi:hypothetical protein
MSENEFQSKPKPESCRLGTSDDIDHMLGPRKMKRVCALDRLRVVETAVEMAR